MKPTDFLKEDASGLNIGDPVIITGKVQFQGKTGDIVDFGKDKRFVIVNLYNYGKHSFNASDVSYNDYAESGEEQEYLSQFEGKEDKKTGTIFVGQLKGTDPASKVRDRLVGEAKSLQSKFEKHLAKHGYDVAEKGRYWEQKIKDIDAQIAAWDAEMERRKQGKTTNEGVADFQVGDQVKFMYMQKPEIWRDGTVTGHGRDGLVHIKGERNEYAVHPNMLKKADAATNAFQGMFGGSAADLTKNLKVEKGVKEAGPTPDQKKWHKAVKKAQSAKLAKHSFSKSDLERIARLDKEADDIGRAAKPVNEFAPSNGHGDGGPSKIVQIVDKLLQAGNKVDCMVLGARGHVVKADLKGGTFGDCGLHMKKYNKPYAKTGLYRPFVAHDDDKYEVVPVGPKHYAIKDVWPEEFNEGDELNVGIEAHGVRGADSKKWRKKFKSQAAFEKWLDANEGDVEVLGTREVNLNDMFEQGVGEAQSMGTALRNTLSKVEPGSKLDKKIRHHNDLVRRFGPDAGVMTSAPDGYHIDKKGFVRLGEGVAEGSETEQDIDKKIEFHKQGQAAAQYKGSMNKMHAAKIRDLQAKKEALKQGVAEGVFDQFKKRMKADSSVTVNGTTISINDKVAVDGYPSAQGVVAYVHHHGGKIAVMLYFPNGATKAIAVDPSRVHPKKQGVAEAEYDPSYDPDYRPYERPEQDPDAWKQQRDLEEPVGSVSTVTVRDAEGNVVLQFPSTGEYWGDFKYAANKGVDLENPDYHVDWKRDVDEDSIAEDSGVSSEQVASEIVRRIIFKHKDAISAFGPEAIMAAAREVGNFFAGSDELGTSDIGIATKYTLEKLDQMSRSALGESASAGGTSAGAVATTPAGGSSKNVGSLFGGTYKQKRTKKSPGTK